MQHDQGDDASDQMKGEHWRRPGDKILVMWMVQPINDVAAMKDDPRVSLHKKIATVKFEVDIIVSAEFLTHKVSFYEFEGLKEHYSKQRNEECEEMIS